MRKRIPQLVLQVTFIPGVWEMPPRVKKPRRTVQHVWERPFQGAQQEHGVLSSRVTESTGKINRCSSQGPWGALGTDPTAEAPPILSSWVLAARSTVMSFPLHHCLSVWGWMGVLKGFALSATWTLPWALFSTWHNQILVSRPGIKVMTRSGSPLKFPSNVFPKFNS